MSPAPVFVRIPGSHHPGTRLRLVPGFRDPGSVLILGQVTQYGNPYLICIAQSQDSLTIASFSSTRFRVNSIPELELQFNSNSNSGIGIGIEIGGIENGIGIEIPGIEIGIENRN